MALILMHVLPAALYAVLAVLWARGQRDGRIAAPAPHRAAVLTALVAHGLALAADLYDGGQLRFGLGTAVSLTVWLALVLYWIEGLLAPMASLQVLALPMGAVAALLPAVFPSQQVLQHTQSPLFAVHLIVALLAYSVLTLAALHALMMAVAQKDLHHGRLSRLAVALPPLLTLEALLFRLVAAGFVLLTLTLGSGVLFSEALFGTPATFNHKTLFAALAWMLFGVLLLGRRLWGWRGTRALRLTLAGFACLFLAYVGTRFVLEVLLGRH